VLSFELRDAAARADDFMRRTTFRSSLRAWARAHAADAARDDLALGMSRDERLSLVSANDLIRMSVGIEATEDILEDFEQALA